MQSTRVRRLAVLAAAATFAALATGADSCGSTETKSKPDTRSSSAPAESRPVAHVGDAITLKGTDTTMKVTVLSVIDPLAGGEFDTPPGGKRWVGIRLRLTNVGSTAYDDAPSNGAKVITASDEQADEAIVLGGECSGSFGSDATISPGNRLQGCLAFEVKKHAHLKRFQFGLDSGFGPQTGEWSLR